MIANMEQRLPAEKVEALSTYLAAMEEVAFSVLFGSAASGRLTTESDVDVGVYFAPRTALLEVEQPDAISPKETGLWSRLERILGRSVDLVVLNRVAAGVGAEALRSGTLLSVRDPDVLRRYQLAVSDLAEEFRGYVDDFVKVRARSRSLSGADRSRLHRILDFLERGLTDSGLYGNVTRERYLDDPFYRRSLERWLENLVNASIDIVKVVPAAAGLPMPQTYRESLEETSAIAGFASIASRLARNVIVRNVLAHEYLDVRFPEVQRIATEAGELYAALIDATRAWMQSLPPDTSRP